MSYAVGNCGKHKRHIGYGVPAICDHPDCTEEIDRGLGYLCGEDFHFASCHGYFCEEHRYNYVYGDEIEFREKWCKQQIELIGEFGAVLGGGV